MAQNKQNSHQPTAKQNEERERKEVATKLRNLGPVATAEVVNDVVTKQLSRQVSGFTAFLRDQSVIGIGIGLVLGTQLKTVVDSITNGFVLPLTQLVLPNQKSLADQTFFMHVVGHRSVTVHWGSIVYSLFNFVVIAFIVYAIFKLLKLDRLAKK
ncbi:MAG TPA: MscL family protein [Candidatus Saccharimonadales bacterium]|nr:MscL family protein [Candidatus Saccharimonadales bacterium]